MDGTDTICPVCGYPDLAEPPFGEAGEPSFEICPSCGTEFGVDDDEKSHDELREAWVKSGPRWQSTVTPAPAGWNGRKQLDRAGLA